MQVADVEHCAAEFYNEDLTDENHRRNEEESLTVFDVVERRFAGHKGLGIEHIPELQHHKDSEEQTQLIVAKSIVITELERHKIRH